MLSVQEKIRMISDDLQDSRGTVLEEKSFWKMPRLSMRRLLRLKSEQEKRLWLPKMKRSLIWRTSNKLSADLNKELSELQGDLSRVDWQIL
jgi:hypothetical protein